MGGWSGIKAIQAADGIVHSHFVVHITQRFRTSIRFVIEQAPDRGVMKVFTKYKVDLWGIGASVWLDPDIAYEHILYFSTDIQLHISLEYYTRDRSLTFGAASIYDSQSNNVYKFTR